MGTQIIEGTVLLIMSFLIITNAKQFSTAITAVGDVYVKAVVALQGGGSSSSSQPSVSRSFV
jgi:hypothetical protein